MNPYLMMPGIFKETSEGLIRCTIQEEMFKKREIQCVGEVTQESVNALIMQLRYLQQEDPEKEITMFINSPGGEVSSGLALYDVMKALKCPIRTICIGLAASMAALLFISGNERDMLPHARVMIHDPMITGGIGGSALKIKSISEDLMKTREITGEILAKHSGRSLEEIFEKTATDSYFDAQEAIAYGLADNIIDVL